MSFVEKWKNIENKAKKYSHFTLLMAGLNVLLMMLTAYSFTHQKVVIQLPPTRLTESIVVSSNEVSRSMFDMWGRYIIATIGNYTSENIEDNVYIISSMAHPEYARKIIAEMKELASHVKENRIKQAFFPNWKDAKLEVRANYAQMIVNGKAKREVGTKSMDQNVTYTLKMAVIDGHMYLIEISKEVDEK